MTPCDQSQRLSAYLDGELSAADAARLQGHLAACGACAAELDELRALGRLMGMARRGTWGEPSAAAMDGLRAHVRSLVDNTDTVLLRIARVFSGVAATILIAGLWLLSHTPTTTAAQAKPVPWDVVAYSLTDNGAEPQQGPAAGAATTRESVLDTLYGGAPAEPAGRAAGPGGEASLP